ncbi:AMP-binding protein [Microbispora sp. GKU 823]|uniref:AMP-binding protein n=1 Tax=Microbispora sp. GKU 823 TaxID=1652100 RepID=UPI0009A26F98|nr:AMP-binding protein [Microbispora sp. GKU 823]OPG08990.1 hypothetical protein B1L11_27070 [Microbispora sp. GKU 823]
MRALAAAVRKISPGRSDRIALLCPGTMRSHHIRHAILAAGAEAVQVSPLMSVDEIMRLLLDSGAVVMLCHRDMITLGSQAARMAGIRLFTIGPPSSAPGSDGRLEDLAEALVATAKG